MRRWEGETVGRWDEGWEDGGGRRCQWDFGAHTAGLERECNMLGQRQLSEEKTATFLDIYLDILLLSLYTLQWIGGKWEMIQSYKHGPAEKSVLCHPMPCHGTHDAALLSALSLNLAGLCLESLQLRKIVSRFLGVPSLSLLRTSTWAERAISYMYDWKAEKDRAYGVDGRKEKDR